MSIEYWYKTPFIRWILLLFFPLLHALCERAKEEEEAEKKSRIHHPLQIYTKLRLVYIVCVRETEGNGERKRDKEEEKKTCEIFSLVSLIANFTNNSEYFPNNVAADGIIAPVWSLVVESR